MIEGQMVLMDAAIEVKADSLRRGSRLTIGFSQDAHALDRRGSPPRHYTSAMEAPWP